MNSKQAVDLINRVGASSDLSIDPTYPHKLEYHLELAHELELDDIIHIGDMISSYVGQICKNRISSTTSGNYNTSYGG